MVLVWKYEDGLHALWRGASAERYGVWRAFKGAVQMLEVRKNDNCRDQAAHGRHRGDDAASLLRPRQCHQFEPESASSRSALETAREQKCDPRHSLRPLERP